MTGASRSACACRSAARRLPGVWSKIQPQTAAMLTTFNEVDMSAVMNLRARQKETFKAKYGVSLGVASFFVKAAVVALKEFPRINAEVQGDEMVLKHYYDIGIAVGAAEGLVVPVLRNADRMPFAEIELHSPCLRDESQRRHADARRPPRRHVQHHQRRRVRIAHEHPDPESPRRSAFSDCTP